jgi:ribonuclease HI
MSKFYAVKEGRKPGVYTSWAQVKMLVDGYQGAVYKKFNTHAEAQHFVETGEVLCNTSKKRERIVKEALTDNGELHIYTDGAFSSKTKRSGLGVAWDPPFTYLAIGRRLADGTTNQQAELEAIRSALRAIDADSDVQRHILQTGAIIWTDSDYSCRCLADYIHRWRENGWKTSSGNPVKHRRIIEDCDRLLTKLRHVKLRHISEVGLSSHDSEASVRGAEPLTIRVWDGNRRADELARGI